MSENKTPGWRLARRRRMLIAYLLEKADEGDWHGVADAANDLRCVEAEMRVREIPIEDFGAS